MDPRSWFSGFSKLPKPQTSIFDILGNIGTLAIRRPSHYSRGRPAHLWGILRPSPNGVDCQGLGYLQTLLSTSAHLHPGLFSLSSTSLCLPIASTHLLLPFPTILCFLFSASSCAPLGAWRWGGQHGRPSYEGQKSISVELKLQYTLACQEHLLNLNLSHSNVIIQAFGPEKFPLC